MANETLNLKGIDVCGYQGDINFKKVKEGGVDFVIVKAGYSTSTVESWERNYANASNNDLKVGAYWYSYASTIEDVKAEANAFINALKGKKLSFPVYYDIEEKRQFDNGKAFVTEMVETFCSILQNAGYYPGIYCSTYWYENFVEEETRKKYPAWIADYRGECLYHGDYGIWQYGVGTVYGVPADCDMDIGYVDYSIEIKEKGLNGFTKDSASTAQKTNEELAYEVLNGDWGAGEARKERLTAAGYDYYAVQKEVNKIVYGQKKTVDELAQEVIEGKWGVGDERYRRLTEAGYDYYAVQRRVNEILYG